MKLQCLNCHYEFEGDISLDELGWHSVCPECGSSFDADVPEGRIIMAFTDSVHDAEDTVDKYSPNGKYRYFTDNFTGKGIHTYYAFDTAEEFIKKWLEIYDRPNGMWYWVLDMESPHENKCICSGACDPDDIEIFNDYFGLDAKI